MINIAIKLATSITYTADGSQTNFSVPFDYLRPSFVHVAVNDAEVSEGFTISNRMVMFDSAPAKDAVVHIYRSTPTTRLVSWADASILKAIDMTIAEVQQLHILEEGQDWSKTNSIILDRESGAWQGRNYRISNITDPTEAQDVVTKHYLENTEDSFVQRMNAIKTQTEQFANTAGNSKDSAYKSAQSASVSAASAAESAKLAEGYKNIAETAKSNASLYAANAKTSADNAGASKEAAQSAATAASNFASAARNSAGEAKTHKDNAKTYMDNAKNYSENVNVFVPSVSSAGVLSWTNKAGLTNPKSVNIKGAKGDTGTAATITIGSVTTGAPGTNASVTNSGTTSNAVLDFTLPSGKDGKDGGITVDGVLSDTSGNPVQNYVLNRKFNTILLPNGQLSVPSSDSAYLCKLTADALSSINDITQTTIEQSADGKVWEKVFDSDSTSAQIKLAYLYGLQLPTTITIPSGYMARVTFATHTTSYFSNISLFLVARSPSASNLSYKGYTGSYEITTPAMVKGTISTWGSWASSLFTMTKYNIVQYIFNEDKKADSSLSFMGMQCKGTVPFRNVLRFDEKKRITTTPFGLQAPTYNGFTLESSVPANAKFIDNETSNTWTGQQTFNKAVLKDTVLVKALIRQEVYQSEYTSGTTVTPTHSTMCFTATGATTLDMTTIVADFLSVNKASTVFTAYITSDADYTLTITNAGTIKYIGSASDVAITSAGLLLNIMMLKDASGNLTSIVQASKLEGGA